MRGERFADTCYGEGDLEDRLADIATCVWRSDIRETVGSSKVMDALSVTRDMLGDATSIIQNPPYTRTTLYPLMDHWLSLGLPVWLLLPADMMHNVSFGKYMKHCKEVVSVGRLFWFRNSWKQKWLPWDELPIWAVNKYWVGSDQIKGLRLYEGWWDDVKDKPSKSKYTRGVDNYAWYCFVSKPVTTVLKGR